MFDSLDDYIRRDERATTTTRDRWLFVSTVLLIACVLFASLYAGVQYLG